MYLCSFVLYCLGNVFFVAGAGMKMRENLQPQIIPILDVQADIPKRLRYSRLLSPLLGDIEILEERDIFGEIMKFQLNNHKRDIDLQLLRLQIRPANRINKSTRNGSDMAKTNLRNRQYKQLRGRTNEMMTKQAKPKKIASRTNYIGSETKIQLDLKYEKLGETRFEKNVWSKKHKNVLGIVKHRDLMLETKENVRYQEAKGTNYRSRRIELLTSSRRNRQPKAETEVVSQKVKPTNGGLKIIGLLSKSWRISRHLELPPRIDGDKEVTSTNNLLRGVGFYNITTRHLQHKGGETEIPKLATLPQDGSREDVPLDPNTNRELTHFPKKEDVMSKEVNPTKNGPPFVTTTDIQLNCFPGRGEEETSVGVIPTTSGSRRNELSLDTTTNRPPTLRWRAGVVVATEDIPISTEILSDTWRKTQLELKPEREDNESHRGDRQTKLWVPSDPLLQTEGSGSSELKQKQAHESNIISSAPNRTSSQHISITRQTKRIFNLQLSLTTPEQSSDNTQPSPTSKKDAEIPRVTDTALSKGLYDSVFSPLEATVNNDSGSTYCKPGYKEYGGVCRSLCDIDGVYCENGGRCVIVENIGPMCRCHQTNYLCYSGGCCRSSLTPIQLTCVIASCCILLSVFLGCLPAFIWKMDIKAVSKSVRTRLWISTLMPDASVYSSSHSVESDFTVCSDYDSPPDLSTFHCTKEVTCDSNLWTCESTRL